MEFSDRIARRASWTARLLTSLIVFAVCLNGQPAGLLLDRRTVEIYHWTNLLLHAACTLLLFGFLKKLTGVVWPSALVAFLFAFHPLQVESVVELSQSKDVLGALMWMLAVWAYISYATRPKPEFYALTIFFYCLGILANPMVVTLPAILALIDVWPLRRSTSRAHLREKLPLLAVGLLVFAVADSGKLHWTSLSTCLHNAGMLSLAFLGKALWPTHLAVLYPAVAMRPVWVSLTGGALLAAITLWALSTIRTRPYVTVGWLWYGITLLPTAAMGASTPADHYTYLPSIGLFLILAWGGLDAWRHWPALRPVLTGVCAIGCLACAVVTRIQLTYWQNSESLFQHSIAATGDNALAHASLAKTWQERGMYDEAIAEYRRSVAISPNSSANFERLGRLLYIQGHTAEAIPPTEAAVRLEPDDAALRNDLGILLAAEGRLPEAARQFETAIRLKPDFQEAHIRLGHVLSLLGRQTEAELQYSKGQRPVPVNSPASFTKPNGN